MSNQTKLSAQDKAFLKELRSIQGPEFEVFHFPEQRVTVGVRYIPGHNTARVFVSLASPEETKFRKKVGEYIVRDTFDAWVAGNTFAGTPSAVHPAWYNEPDVKAVIAESLAYSVGFQAD